MRLLHSQAREFREFLDFKIPKYAILSHRWGSDEATFQDFEKGKQKEREGYAKIDGCCKRALEDEIDWVWIDTCCIDKKSSAELSEAINSMYSWYQNADVCYVYLVDVWSNGSPSSRTFDMESFRSSSWFTRGWTLQELLAPPCIRFFDQFWQCGVNEQSLAGEISVITGIDRHWLLGFDDDEEEDDNNDTRYQSCTYTRECQAHGPLRGRDLTRREPSVATKMSWASKRKTTRIEDMAYCLLGIFNVNMPLLYGEGRKAFQRLQQEIMKQTNDDSIFAWASRYSTRGVLAPWPSAFDGSRYVHKDRKYPRPPYAMTNQGLHFPITWRAVQKRPAELTLWIPLNCGMCGPEGFQNLVICLHDPGDDIWSKICSDKLLEMDNKLYQNPSIPIPKDERALLNRKDLQTLEHPCSKRTDIMLRASN
ncbi:MAG: hypothetical protein L6R41_001778 [Letrouitia leprolyta]|nr:MAG: hypothetical protein L6R41_001778 [Letrouitia leprolyta]